MGSLDGSAVTPEIEGQRRNPQIEQVFHQGGVAVRGGGILMREDGQRKTLCLAPARDTPADPSGSGHLRPEPSFRGGRGVAGRTLWDGRM
jgi:hypothetical protein